MEDNGVIRRKPNVDSTIERKIIIGFITSQQFITEVQTMYRSGIFRSSFANIVADWCMEYYDKYKKPPGIVIEDIFREKGKKDLLPDQIETIEKFLSGLSDEYEFGDKFNAPFALDEAEQYFRLSALEDHKLEIAQCITGGRIEDGEKAIATYNRVTRAEIKGVNPFDDATIIKALDENSGDRLFRLHGDLGRQIGDLERGFLLGIVGVSGIGKTWWLMYIALRALFSGYKVLFVSLEMSELQMVRRILHWLTGQPKRVDGDVLIPVFDCILHQMGVCDKAPNKESLATSISDKKNFVRPSFYSAPRNYKPCTECMGTKDFEPTSWYRPSTREKLDIQSALRKKKQAALMGAVKGNRFKVVQFPSGELTMRGLGTHMDNLSYYEGFDADVVITDFADKFGAEHRKDERRDGLNEIWEGHKALAQARHQLVVSASQSNQARNTGKDTKRGDWSDDIRKLTLIDVGFIINQTEKEKDMNIYRCGVAKQRHDEYSLLKQVMVLNCLKIGRPYIDSYLM